jgi:hypothetical protein
VYFNHLGELKGSIRSPVTVDGKIKSLYYFQSRGALVFYDKIKEQKKNRQPVPELYQGSNVLRYEQRNKKRLSKSFNTERVTGAMLYNEKFYTDAVNRWRNSYFSIEKINDTDINVEKMRTVSDLHKLGILSLSELNGGQLSFLSKIKELQQMGKITNKQAFDLKSAVKDACMIKEGLTVKSEAVSELDKKVREAAALYR